jgi:hypothetical protein
MVPSSGTTLIGGLQATVNETLSNLSEKYGR